MPERTIRSIIQDQALICATPKTSVAAASRQMKHAGIGAIMVVDRKKLVGIFTGRDAVFRVLAEERDAQSTHLAQVMTANPQTISPDKPFGCALHMMYQGHFRHMPVVEDGRPIGMVSTRDALVPEVQTFEIELIEHEHITEILA